MYSVNGVPLDNAALGWSMMAGSAPLSDLTVARQQLTRQGRHGTVKLRGGILDAPVIPIVVETPRRHLETLQALLMAEDRVLTLTSAPVRELRVECMSTVLEGHGMADERVDVTATLSLPDAAWRGPLTTSGKTLDAPSVALDCFAGLSVEVLDPIVRVRGPVTSLRVTDSGGSWVSYPQVPAGSWLRLEGARAWVTTSDTWTGGTDVSGIMRRNGPRRVFEIAPLLQADPTVRTGRVTVSTVTRGADARIDIRGRSAHLQAER